MSSKEEQELLDHGELDHKTRISPPSSKEAKKEPQILAALAANVGTFVMGCSMGWSSSVQSQLTGNGNDTAGAELYGPWFIDMTEDQMSWVASLVCMGAIFGAIIGGVLMDGLGRKAALMCTTLPAGSGWVVIGLARTPGMFYFGRLCCGLAGGVCSVVAPTYTAEISTPKMRGPLGMLFWACLTAGFLTSSILGWLPWRWASLLLSSMALLLFGVMHFVPESPYFLIWKRRNVEDAKAALQWLRGPDYDVKPELNVVETRVRVTKSKPPHVDLVFLPWVYRPLVLSISLMVFQQMAGISVVLFYSADIFRLAGSNLDALLCGLIISVILTGTVVLGAAIVERLGRRVLFIMSTGFCCLSTVILGAYFAVLDADPDTAAMIHWLPFSCLVLYAAAFSIGLGPLPWLCTSEFLPLQFRAPGISIATCINWTISFVLVKLFPNMQESLMGTSGTFWLFGGFCFLAILFGVFVLPETRRKTVEQIETIFEK